MNFERMKPMRDFSWNYFANTGDVNAYLLFKAAEQRVGEEIEEERSEHDEQEGEET